MEAQSSGRPLHVRWQFWSQATVTLISSREGSRKRNGAIQERRELLKVVSKGSSPADPFTSPSSSSEWLIDLEMLKLGERIASGGSSIVYSASYAGFPVAVKVMSILKDNRGKDEVREEFRREATLLSRMHHMNIIRFFGVAFLQRVYSCKEFCPHVLNDIIFDAKGTSSNIVSAIASAQVSRRSALAGRGKTLRQNLVIWISSSPAQPCRLLAV